MSKTVIADHPPQDGRQWECQCARCGSEMEWKTCDGCDDGFSHHDCGEDTCCCLDPDNNITCQACEGDGGWQMCLARAEWCWANPMPGREAISDGQVEWYTLEGEFICSASDCKERVRVKGSECISCFSARLTKAKDEAELRQMLEDRKTQLEGEGS